MASPMDCRSLAVEIRKLRKKLRQIDNLNRLDRPLTEEEEDKVERTSTIRSLLQEKLQELALAEQQDSDSNLSETADYEGAVATPESSFPQDDEQNEEVLEDVAYDYQPTEMKRPYSEANDEEVELLEVAAAGGEETLQLTPEVKADVNQHGATPPKLPRQEAEPEKVAGQEKRAGQEKASAANQGKPQPTSKGRSKNKKQAAGSSVEGSWARAKFMARELEGHNDVICAVSCNGSRLLTGSRDTMAKYWDLENGTELRSLGAHSGTVSAVILLSSDESSQLASEFDLSSNDRIAMTGSKDCYIKVWSLETGQSLHSIYTYNPVKCLGYMPQRMLIVSGSDGGKVELWDIKSGSNVFSVLGHDDAVTCIQINNLSVCTSSSDGIIKYWQLRDNSLHPIFVSENISSTSSTHLLTRRHIRSLAVPLGDTIYYGDDGLNVKALEWKRGLVHKLKNHSGDFGSTDSMSSTKELLICAGYNLDSGCGYLNFWSLPEEVYLATLSDSDISRITAMDCTQTPEGALRIVTGGQELRVWDKIPTRNCSPQDAIPAEFNSSFSVKPQDSDLDSDTTDLSDSDGGGAHERRGRRWSQGSEETAKSSWSSWCNLV